ncbi:MAG TPA: VOC family protein [Alphaproteobacteria bacterium]|nr:VOC family protein [Alphaproteobacteria bacterium]
MATTAKKKTTAKAAKPKTVAKANKPKTVKAKATATKAKTAATRKTAAKPKAANGLKGGLPQRLHHNAYVTKDQEATRKFYEELIGLPLVATWTEADVLFGKERVYCHTFFGLGDGSALAFFQFVNPSDQKEFGPKMPSSPFIHIALKSDKKNQDAIYERLVKAGYKEPQMYILEHGYCRSLYVKDPNDLILEFTVDHKDVKKIDKIRRETSHADLKRWLGGNHDSNNMFR